MGRLTAISLIAIGTAFLVQGRTRTRTAISPSETVDTEQTIFSSGGLLEMKDSVGDVQIEGWDEPEVQIVVTKYSTRRTAGELERVVVTTERSSDDHLVITTRQPFHRSSDVRLVYQIKVPRKTRLAVAHQRGALRIRDVTASMRLSNRVGPIELSLPENERYAIDAKTMVGAVDSDWTAGPAQDNSLPPIYLQVRVGTGHITLRRSPSIARYLRPRTGSLARHS